MIDYTYILLIVNRIPDILMLANARILMVITGNQHKASVNTIKKNRYAKPRSLDVVVAVFLVFYERKNS